MRLWALACGVCLGACAAPAGPAAPAAAPAAGSTTAGAEAPAPVLRTTIPVPVPQPAIERRSLSAPLQTLWERVEIAVAVRPPEPPTEASTEAVETWARGPFTEWLLRRAQASQEAQEPSNDLESAPAVERGMAAGLLGYMQEDTCADVRGAPIPEAIATDADLLRVYDEALRAALLPYARVSVSAYRFCVAAFDEVQDPAWSEWRAYCDERGREVAEVFGVPMDTPGSAP